MKMRIVLLLTSCFLLCAGQSFAAGFALIEQSVKGLGTAYSGGAAAAEDASTVFFNPAGMTLLEGTQSTAGIHVIVPQADFRATVATDRAGASILASTADGNGGQLKPVPNAYLVHNPGNGVVFGIGINAPFGMATEYDRSWVGRYHAVGSDVKTININPSMAYKINKNLSAGAGISAQYIEATLSSMIYAAPGNDVFSEMTADDWGFGYNFGLLLTTDDARTRLGASYRSQVDQHLKGDVNFDFTSAPGIPAAFFPAQGVGGDISLPASAQVSLYHRFSPEFAMMADAMWTDWSVFKELKIDFDLGIGGPGLPIKSTTTPENWRDNMRYSVGAAFNPTPQLTLRGGVALDTSPIPDNYRTPRIPGNDRYWVAFGAGYASGNWAADFGYAHLYVKNGTVNLNSATNLNALVGSFDNQVDIISAEMSYKF